MASTGNPNQQPAVSQQQPFDINKYFKPSNASPPLPLPQSFQNPNNYGPPTPSASYPPPTAGPYSFPLQNPPLFYHHIPNFPPQDQHSTLNHQRSVSFPTPPLQPVPSAPPQNANPGARLMAMLSSPPTDFNYSLQIPTPVPASIPSSSDYPLPTAVPVSPSVVQPMHSIQSAPIRMPSSKLPRGRHLAGDHIIYDIDARLQGEEQPQLEVTPITKYVSDPGLILGHQIAVNKTYICYGLKMGNIRVLNINTALRSLLRGHTQRVTDMAFFAEDVHLLASASIEGRVYVWKISEGINDEEKPLISGNIVLAIHITRDEGSVHPRVCWHCHKQEILVVAIGKSVLKIDTTKVCKGVEFSVEEPLVCAMDKLIDGVQLVGNHEGEVTDLSMCQWMTTRLVSSSKDGTIKIWEDRKAHPLLVLRPHDGHPVDAAKFLPAPHRPEHIMLITAGLLNREVKLWASADEEGWLLPSDAESWRCIQTLELKSSAEPRNEEAFFNQVVALSQGGLLLLANAKKNAIYAIHLEYGANPAATRMDYLAEFTVTMPILSFTGTSDALPHGEHLVQVYCVQTQAIQQYALDLSQCLPPPLENFSLEKSESTVSHDAAECVPALETSGSKSLEAPFSAAKPINHTIGLGSLSESKCSVSAASDATSVHETMTSVVDANPSSLPSASNNEAVSVASPSLPLSPKLSKKLSDLRGDQAATEYSFDRQMDSAQTNSSALPVSNDDSRALPGNASDIANPPVMFKHPTHLVTPFEIMATSSADATRVFEKGENEAKIQDVGVSNDTGNVEVEVKVVGETAFVNTDEPTRQVDPEIVIDRKEKSFYSQASDLGVDMNRECCALPSETSVMEEAKNSIMEALAQPSNSGEEGDEANNDMSGKAADYAVSTAVPQSPTQGAKGKKKGKNPQPSSSLSPLPSVSNSVELLQGTVPGSSLPFMESSASQMLAMQETLNQILTMQKQMSSVVSTSVAKEGRRLEVALGRSIEKASKANSDALWARTQEEITKLEKSLRERIQQTHGLVNNIMSKDFVAVFERTLKKELAAVGTNVARTISPVIEKTISSAISDSFQRGVGEKAVSQLEKSVTSKLEAIVARQIQAQFQTSGKQALQDGLRSCLEASIIPAFEMSCKAMFEQVDSAFQKGVAEHTAAVQHQFETANSQLALTLRDALTSASSLTQTLSGELADNQRKLLALAAAGANSNTGNSLVTQRSNGPLGLHEKVELPFDPTKELSRLISEHKYEEAFTTALQRSDVAIVSWLCSQVDLQHLLSTIPLPLSQGVLLSLLQQLSCDITKDTARKLTWMTDAASCILPHDPMIAVHVRPILEQVYQILNHQRNLPSSSSEELSKNRVLMHLINAMLMTCK